MCELNQVAGVLPVCIILDLRAFVFSSHACCRWGPCLGFISATYPAVSWCSCTVCVKLWQINELTTDRSFMHMVYCVGWVLTLAMLCP